MAAQEGTWKWMELSEDLVTRGAACVDGDDGTLPSASLLEALCLMDWEPAAVTV